MKYKKNIAILLFSCFLILCIVTGLNYIVNPFGVWDSHIIFGFNNYKYGQTKYTRLYKAYELYDRKPEVVFFGDSRVLQGLSPHWADKRTYNSAFGGTTLNEIEKMVVFSRGLPKKPKLIIIGIPFNAEGLNGDFSEERLHFISKSWYHFALYKVKETLLSISAVDASIRTVFASSIIPDLTIFQEGWRSPNHFGRIIKSDLYMWKYALAQSYTPFYKNPALKSDRLSIYNRRTLETIMNIQNICNEANINVIFVFLPQNLERNMLEDMNGDWNATEHFKRQLVNITPFWDFSMLNDDKINRNNYIDVTHFKRILGEMVIDTITSDNRTINSFGILLSKDNIDDKLVKIRDKYDYYKRKDIELFTILQDGSFFTLEDKELEKYIQLSNKPKYIEDGININAHNFLLQGIVSAIVD